MLDKHRNKGEEDWQVFGECVRKAMCEASGMKLGTRLSHADKFLYKDYMGSVIDKVDIKGKRFFANGSRVETITEDCKADKE